MKINVSNKKSQVNASIEEVENNMLILECNDSYRFKENETVEIKSEEATNSTLPGTVLTSNPNQLLVEVSDNVIEKLDLTERRKTPRYNVSPPIPCTLIENHASGFTKQYNGFIHDLSINGMKVSAEFPLSIKQQYEIRIQLDNHSLSGFTAEIMVRNSRFEIEIDTKAFGSTVEAVNWENQEKLNHFVAELQKQLYYKPSFLHKLRSLILG